MSEDILFEHRGDIGLVTLNRPKALNSLTADMCLKLREQLIDWAEDEGVKAVVIQGAGDKAFCAGGDVISLYKSGMAYRDGDQNSLEWQRFFKEEYRMNTAIKEFPKPYIAILDGITMGGGVGISVHGSHCIATERTMLAMPETGLGLVPDVGGGWFLPRLPGEVGMYLALTGDRLKAAETTDLGITRGFVPGEKINTLIAALSKDASDVDGTLAGFYEAAGTSKLDPFFDKINENFKGNSVEEILGALKADGSEWAMTWLGRLLKKAPTSMKVTFLQMRRGRGLESFRENMQMEYRIVNHTIPGHDFYEGVRAILLDKDNNPKWAPATLSEVSGEMVLKHFEKLGDDELEF